MCSGCVSRCVSRHVTRRVSMCVVDASVGVLWCIRVCFGVLECGLVY